MHWKKCFGSEHLEAADLDGKAVTLTITGIEATKVEGEGEAVAKMLIRFKGKAKTTWIAPVTSAHCMAAMFGDDTDAWVGKRVTVAPQKVEAFGEIVDAVRPVGSPDIAKPVTLRVRQGRRKITLTMQPTGAQS